jgi:hypothetical protein
MKTIQSADGTTIVFDKRGRGPALILVDGAGCPRQDLFFPFCLPPQTASMILQQPWRFPQQTLAFSQEK